MSGKEKVLRVHLKTQSYNSVKTIRVQEKAKNVEIIKEVGLANVNLLHPCDFFFATSLEESVGANPFHFELGAVY